MYLLAGGIGGFLSGLLGIGGGLIFVFVISTALSLSPAYNFSDASYAYIVILNSIFCVLFTAFSGCVKLYRNREFNFKAIAYAGVPAALSASLATFALSQISYSKNTFLVLFSLALIPTLFKFVHRKKETVQNVKRGNAKFSLSGLFAGIGSALTGLGGGFLFSPILHGYFRYPVKKTFAISLGVIFVSSLSILLTYFITVTTSQSEGLNFQLIPEITAPLIIGSILTAPIGIIAAQKLKDNYLRILFFLFAIIILAKNVMEIIK